MDLVTLTCALVEEPDSVFGVKIEDSAHVWKLKNAIKAKKPAIITCDAKNLRLFLAKTLKTGDTEEGESKKGDTKQVYVWLTEAEVRGGVAGISGLEELDAVGATLRMVGLSKTDVQFPVTKELVKAKKTPVHVLVVVPTDEAALPDKKRQRTIGIDCLPLDELVALAEGAKELQVGTLLDTPDTIFGTAFDNGLYIRQEYLDLYEIIWQRLKSDLTIRRILVIGSPGIGKSVFGVLLLLVFMADKMDVAYRPLGHPQTYYFNWNSTNGYEISYTPRAEKLYEGLFDGTESDGALECSTIRHAYLFASPRTKNYNHFVKDKCFKVYMNPWTKTECRGFADAIHFEDQDEWLRRFNLVGGKPRFLFSSFPTFEDLEQRVKDDVPHNVDELKEQVRLFEQNVFDDRMKHIVFYLYRNENAPSRSYLSFSSLVVETIVSARCDIHPIDKVRSLLRTPELNYGVAVETSAPNLQSLRVKHIKNSLLEGLAISKFCMRSLEGSDVETETQYGPLYAMSTIIQQSSEIQNKLMLYIPLSKPFPTMDGVLVVPEARRIIYAQATVGAAHPIEYQHLKEVYMHLTQRQNQEFQGYAHILLFIVSDDIYDGFTVQLYQNANKKSRTASIDIEVTQHVGKIIQ